jgi:hypothetical protein
LSVPETISPAPAGFGSFGGQYLVPDPGLFGSTGTSTIWTIPQDGGSPTPFLTVNDLVLGGIFLPASFGQYAGNYLMGGGTELYALDSSPNISVVADVTNTGFFALSSPVLAPSGFGSGAGNVFIAAEGGPDPSGNGGILELSPTGQVSVFLSSASNLIFPFGLAFAPSGFGAFGGQLLVSDAGSGNIDAISSSGQVTPFVTIPLLTGQGGLRQMAFAPGGFGNLGGDLILSVSGSGSGLGAVYALDSAGQIDAALQVGTQLQAFDPRGLSFPDSSTILISDAADPILFATAADFGPVGVPEPASLLMAGTALGLGLYYWLRTRRRRAAIGSPPKMAASVRV